MSSNALRVVILGGGMIGEIHRRAAVAAGAHVVGVMASCPDRSDQLASRWKTAALHHLDQLDAVRPDVVHVCTPNALHLEQTRAALEVGAHVVCEKPLGLCVEEGVALAEQARALRRVATVPYVYRFHPLVRELRQRALDGEFGPWQLLHGSYLQDWLLAPTVSNWRLNPRLGGTSRAFADIGSHWCDLMEFTTGERIAAVMASMGSSVPGRGGSFSGKTEDTCVLMFRTRSDVLGSLTVSQVSAGRKNRLWFEFDGARQSAVFDQECPETVWLGRADCAVTLFRDPGQGSAEQRRLSPLPPGHAQGFAQCFDHFVADTYAAVRGKRPDGLPDFDDGLRSLRLIEAVLASASSGQWQSLD